MQPMLVRALIVLVPASLLVAVSLARFRHGKGIGSFLQLMGATCLLVVVLTHVCEALHLLPWMQWGRPQSIGHYLDLWSAAVGLTLVPAGYALARKDVAA